MSEFDKEAEREKLREKFAKDEEKRQSTKRMSELLLKGATMTNSHCNRCGDPVFRFDGQEFCPSCQDATVAGGQIQLRNPEGRQPDEQKAEANQPTQTTQTAQTSQAAQPAQATGQEQSTEEPASAAEPASEETRPATQDTEVDVEPTQPPVPSTESVESTSPSSAASQATATGNADLDAARASLRRTVTRYAEEAEQTDDPRRARELLAAAHEAAETLAALRR